MSFQIDLDTTPSYGLLIKQCQALLDGEPDPIANAANLSSLLFHSLPQVNWAGFYFLQGEQLVLGPYHGQPACTRIPVGEGVCGTAFATGQTQRVDDVYAFPGHIACDAQSASEIVVPFRTDSVSGVLDIDSPVKARFAESEQQLFEHIVQVYCASL